MKALPTGTLTLLFSDIEGSTALLHRLGPRWGEALSTHRAILREAWEQHGGTEMGTEGDSFFVVFRSAHEAVDAAVAGQRGLQRQVWPDGAVVRVRMGLHTGEPQRHEDGYIGEDVHRAARIGSTAHGGQIVLSTSTRRLIQDRADLQVRDLGHHRLKDFDADEHLFDLVVPDLLTDFPPLRSLGRRASLPIPPTPLIGRDVELAAVVDAASGSRLVTITGTGGSGKTRLAIAAAAQLAPSYTDGVYFVALHTADTAAAMWATLADALDVMPGAADSVAAAVLARLAARELLLVLDNLEQIDAPDTVVAALLSGAPRVSVLAASRRPLMLAGEHEFPLSPLTLPSSDEFAEVTTANAVEMFVQYAQLARPDFTVTEENAADVAVLCRQLDGLPLALELAAAQSRVLGPRALVARLDSRLGTGVTAADRPDRQRTLGATIAWSYDRLDEPDRSVLRRLGVFRGPADLDAVAAVCGSDDDDPLDVVSRLVATNLIKVAEGADGEPRVSLLQTIRAFALDQLQIEQESEQIRDRHLSWVLGATTAATAMLRGTLHTRALDHLAAINEDIRGALEFALEPGGTDAERIAIGLQLLVEVTTRYWYRFGSVAEARAWQERGLQVGADDLSETGIGVLHGLGMSQIQQGEHLRAEQTLRRSLQMAEQLQLRDAQARALNAIGIAQRFRGDSEAALQSLRASLAISRQTGNAQLRRYALGNLVPVLIDQQDFDGAIEAARQSMQENTEQGDEWGLAIDHLNYVNAVLGAQGAQEAHVLYRTWAPSVLAFQDNELLVDLLELGAAVVAGLGEHPLAVQLLAAADARRVSVQYVRSPAEQALVDVWLDRARAALPPQDWEAAYAVGRTLTPEDGMRLAMDAGVREGKS